MTATLLLAAGAAAVLAILFAFAMRQSGNAGSEVDFETGDSGGDGGAD